MIRVGIACCVFLNYIQSLVSNAHSINAEINDFEFILYSAIYLNISEKELNSGFRSVYRH